MDTTKSATKSPVTPMPTKVIKKLTDMWINNPANWYGIDWLLIQELYCYVPHQARLLDPYREWIRRI